MADKDRPDDAPQLELPSLGSMFRRKKKGGETPAPAPASSNKPTAEDFQRLVQPARAEDPAAASREGASVADSASEAPGAASGPVQAAAPADGAASEPVEAAVPETPVKNAAEPAAAAEETVPPTAAAAEPEAAAPAAAVDEPTVAPETAATSTPSADARPEPAAETEPEPVAETEPTVVLEARQRPSRGLFSRRKPADQTELAADEADVEETAVLATAPLQTVAAERVTKNQAADRTADHSIADNLAARDAEEAAAAVPPPPETVEDDSADDGWRFLSLPEVSGPIAAGITGAVVGLIGVALTYFGLAGCEAIKGTSSCGGSGIGVLILILIALVAIGSLLLTAWKVTDPTSTSFLAVGLHAVICLLFLIDVMLSPAMIVVVPVITVATYLASHWVTTNFVEDE